MDARPSKARLIALGVIAIVLGGFTTLGAFSTFFGMYVGFKTAAAASGHPDQLPMAILAVPMMFYLFSATSLIWLGIGTILARRWARALMIVLSWLYLIADALLLIAAIVGLTLGGHPPGAPEWIVLAFTFAFVGLIGVGLPIVFIALYSSKETGKIFDAWGPPLAWTDRAPLPVLALAVLQSGASLVCLILAVSGLPLPVAGDLWHGAQARVGYLLFAAVCGALVLGVYRLRMGAWWGALLVPLAVLGSAVIAVHGSGVVALAITGAGWAAYLLWLRPRFS